MNTVQFMSLFFFLYCFSVSLMQTLSAPIPVHPLVVVGFTGMIVSALNLMPIGKLDGGRASAAVFGRRTSAVLGTLTLLLQASILSQCMDGSQMSGHVHKCLTRMCFCCMCIHLVCAMNTGSECDLQQLQPATFLGSCGHHLPGACFDT